MAAFENTKVCARADRRKPKAETQKLLRFRLDYELRDDVWFPRASQFTPSEFPHDDGDEAEASIHRIVSNAKDKSLFSQELREAIRDWPSRYHLSAARANLLRPFQHLFHSRVLELGAGCGALTRFMGECGGTIVALEGSPHRARIARARTSDLANVSVVCHRIQEFDCIEKFDVIVAIGAAEYACMLGDEMENPERAFLGDVSRLLADQGVLILAMENQLGLKYFNGYASRPPATFGLRTLQDHLGASTLSHQRCFVPLPDHKLPMSIIAPAGFDEPRFNVEPLFVQSVNSDSQRPESFTFSLEQAWSHAVRNRLAQSLANSFLVVAGRNAQTVAAATSADCIAWHYSVERHPFFTRETRFVRKNDDLVVEKNRLCDARKPDVPINNISRGSSYINGTDYWFELVTVVNQSGWSTQDIAEWSRAWIDLVARESGTQVSNNRSLTNLVPGALLDATPLNCIRNPNGRLQFIDLEWRVQSTLELGFVLFRGLRDSILKVTSCAEPAPGTLVFVNRLVMAVFAELGLTVTDSDIDRFAFLEQRLQKWVAGYSDNEVDSLTIEALWRRALSIRIADGTAAADRLALSRARIDANTAPLIQHFERANDQLAEARSDLARRLDEVNRHAAESDAVRLELAKELAVADTNATHAVKQIADLEATRADLTRRLDAAQARPRQLGLQVESITPTVQLFEKENFTLLAQNKQILRYAHRLEEQVRKESGLRFARFLGNYVPNERVKRFARLLPGPLLRSLKRARLLAGPNLVASSPTTTINLVAEVVRRSGFFDPDDYDRRAGLSSWGFDPALHYVLVGERLGISPSARFDPTYYGDRYPDVAHSGNCLLAHYVEHGRREGRGASPVARDLAAAGARFRPEKESIILVCHEASRTGAPILALTIGRSLCARYNLVTVLLRGGDLVENFRQISSRLICLEDRNQIPVEFKHGLSSILCEQPIRYAILNSIECKDITPYLGAASIPTVNLINEFSSYTRPLRTVREALGWTTELVFSAQVTADSFSKEHPALLQRRVHILPQGRCSLPASTTDAATLAERQYLEAAMRPPGDENALVVLGAGSVHIRKGVDLFIASAKAALRLGGKRCRVRFVWIGHGYNPEVDMSYSAYIKEQIARSGLEGQFVLLDEVTNLDLAYEMADVFYLASRLDPLPNVAIEAAMRGLPIICFEGASGMAEVLQRNPTASQTVMPHLDAYAAARRIVELAKDVNLRKRIGKATRALARTVFDMDTYVRQLDEIGSLAVDSMRQRVADFETLVNDPSFDPGIFLPANAPTTTREISISRFLTYWSAARTAPHQLDYLDFRRPCAGFNPQIYAHHHPELFQTDINPLADFIRKGRPAGPWLHRVIRPGDSKLKPKSRDRLRTAIQAHFHYPELIGDFLSKIAANEARCDLLLSTNDEAKAEVLRNATAAFDRGRVEIRIVPNRGRDIGSLLTAYGREIVQNYDVVGHLHAKRSRDVDLTLGETWREFLWQHLLGDRYPMMDVALAHLAKDEQLGLVFAEEPHLCDWDDNLAIAKTLAAQAGLETPLPPFFEFPVGTMFWARPQVLAPLLELKLGWSNYPEEPLANDGTILHALERLLPFAARKEGLTYATVHIPGITR